MNKYSILLLSFCLMMLSCDEETVPSITVNQTEFTISDSGVSQSIPFESNVGWTATSSESWCAVSPSSADASTKNITVTAIPNDTYDDRSCTVTITAGGLSETITIKQSSKSGLLVTPDKYDLSNDASTIEVEVKANIEFDVIISDDWITKVTTRGLTTNKFQFNIAKNGSYGNREGAITIKQKGGALTSTIKVYQSQEDAIILSKKIEDLSNESQTLNVELKTNIDFEVIIPEAAKSWVSYTGTRVLRTEKLSLNIAENKEYDARTTEVYVKNKSTSLQDTLTINQSANLGLIVTPEKYELSNDVAVIEVEVKANIEFDVIISEDWITKITTRGLTSTKLQFNIAKNESYNNRNGSITIKQKNGTLTTTIRVYQSQEDAIILSNKKENISNDSQTLEVELKTNVDFEVIIPEAAKSWVSYTPTRGLRTETLSLNITENKEYDARSSEVYVKNKATSLQDTLTINQSQEDAIILSNKTENLSNANHTLQVELKTNVLFEVIIPTAAKSWVSLIPTRALRTEMLTLYIAANESYKARSTEIYVKDKVTSLQDTLTINQEANTVDLVEEGWYMKKTNGVTKKFFPIGSWSIPGYTADRQNGYGDRTNADFFKHQARNVDISVTDYRFWKDFMTEEGLIMMTVQPGQFFHYSHLENIPELSNKGEENGYYRMQYLKNKINDPSFIQQYDNSIISNKAKHPNVELAYLPIDEVAQGLYGHWSTPPVVGDKIYERLNAKDPNSIVFVDLAGHGKGSTFFFEKRYLKTHSSMPADLPYDAIVSKSARDYALKAKTTGVGLPLLSFYEGYDGVPTYQFSNNSYSYTSYTPEVLKRSHYENIKAYAQAYKGNGNAFGINAFGDFRNLPVLAGVTVDAIRDGLNDPTIPIWIFFDGNGYAKPKSMSAAAYAKEVKCQMYTSIIHGATGVFFWNMQDGTHDVWDAHQPALEEIKSHYNIISLKTLEKRSMDDLHIMIKQDENGQKYILASNTSKIKSVPLNVDNVNKSSLAPLEIYVSPF